MSPDYQRRHLGDHHSSRHARCVQPQDLGCHRAGTQVAGTGVGCYCRDGNRDDRYVRRRMDVACSGIRQGGSAMSAKTVAAALRVGPVPEFHARRTRQTPCGRGLRAWEPQLGCRAPARTTMLHRDLVVYGGAQTRDSHRAHPVDGNVTTTPVFRLSTRHPHPLIQGKPSSVLPGACCAQSCCIPSNPISSQETP